MTSGKRRQRRGLRKLYRYRHIQDIDAYLAELSAEVHSLTYADTRYKGDADILLDARLALMRERDSDA